MTKVPVPGDNTAALVRLARQVDQLQRDLDDLAPLRGDVEAHTRALADLADLLRTVSDPGHRADPAPAAGGAQPDPAPNWLTVTDPALAIRWLNELHVWVQQVWQRYTPAPGCWPWHPAVVAELLVTHHLWQLAVTDGAGPEPLAAWHDRWRPGTAHRVTRWLTACERTSGQHVTGPGARVTYDPAALDEIAHWWATTHGTHTDTPAPGLTPAPTTR